MVDVLHTPTPKFDFANPSQDIIALAYDLADTMLDKDGLGLAAPQIGVSVRMFVMRANPIIAVVNPEIIDQSEDHIYLEEGCLSYPGLILKVKRPKWIKARFARPNGEIVTEKFIGISARIFQHELDHLDGVVFLNKATAYHRMQGLKNQKQVIMEK